MHRVLSVSGHALDRYKIHNRVADEEMAKWSIQYGEELDPALVAAVTNNYKRQEDGGGRYILSKSSEGWGIWVMSDEDVAITYLRLGPSQITILGGDTKDLSLGKERALDFLPKGVTQERALKDGSVEFVYNKLLIRMTPQPNRGPNMWSWCVKEDNYSKGLAAGWASRDLAVQLLELAALRLNTVEDAHVPNGP